MHGNTRHGHTVGGKTSPEKLKMSVYDAIHTPNYMHHPGMFAVGDGRKRGRQGG